MLSRPEIPVDFPKVLGKTMRINEVEQLNEGFGDWMRAGLYKNLGIGGEKGNAAATMYHFLDGFTQQYKQAMNAAKESGMQPNPSKFIDSYLQRYGWQASKKQKRALMGLAADPKKLAKAMYSVGMSQARDPQGYVMGQQGAGAPAGQGRQAGQRGQQQLNKQQLMKALQQAQAQLKKFQGTPELSSASQGIIDGIKGLTGPENLDDLSAVAKTAMQMLYSQDKEKYNQLYKEITTGQKATDMSPEAQAAAKRVEKLKAAAAAADAEASPFSRMPGSEPQPQPKTPEEFAARRIAKQKAAMAGLNGGPATTAPAATPTEPAAEPAQQSLARPASAIRSASGQTMPTTPSMNPMQVPGARTSLNPEVAKAAPKVAKKVPARVK